MMVFKIYLLTFSVISLTIWRTNTLNEKIYECHKTSVKGYSNEIEVQREFREQYIDDIIKLRSQNLRDTIVIAERHAINCDGCPAEFVSIYSRTKYKTFILKRVNNKFTNYRPEPTIDLTDFKTFSKDINGNYLHADLKQIMTGLRARKKLSNIASSENANDCFDGSITIYTILYPNSKLDAMLIRCWKN